MKFLISNKVTTPDVRELKLNCDFEEDANHFKSLFYPEDDFMQNLYLFISFLRVFIIGLKCVDDIRFKFLSNTSTVKQLPSMELAKRFYTYDYYPNSQKGTLMIYIKFWHWAMPEQIKNTGDIIKKGLRNMSWQGFDVQIMDADVGKPI